MEIIEMAALGRALYPGMLYDCRRDSFIPGVTLWDKTSLTQDLDVRRQPNTDLKFSASDSVSEKASLLDVSASLKASFLGGLVEVGGSAKYLRDQTASAQQSRVTLQYSQTTRFEQLTMTQLGKVTYPQVFKEKTATHVITAVLYGAHAFMVFDKTFSENEDKQEVEGNLSVMIKKIPTFSIEGQGALKMNDKEKKLAENISCTFYGDCVLDENPTTYMEALQLYKKLPSLLTHRADDAVPVKVWLHPLARLDNRAAKIEREIKALLISKLEDVLEEMADVERKYNDLAKDKIVKDFQDVSERLKTFEELFRAYKVLFQKALCRLLPAIRGGTASEEALADILLITSRFPFNKLDQWLEAVQEEVNLLNSYTRELSTFPVMKTLSMFNRILFDPMVDTLLCFSFTSLNYKDAYLSAIDKYVKVNEFEKMKNIPESDNQDILAWFNDPDTSKNMRDNFFLFKSFAEANKNKKKAKFVIASIPDSSNPGVSIHLYSQGKIINNKFQPVSKPPAPIVDIQHKNLVLKLQKSPTDVTVRFRVEHRVTPPSDSGDDDEKWEFTETPDAKETFILTGLQLANQYWVRYRVVSNVGVSEASDSVCVSLKGKMAVPVGNESWNGTTFSLYVGLRNKIMSSQSSAGRSVSSTQPQNKSFVRPITGGLKAGMVFFFQGYVPPASNEFALNLKTGPREGDDIAFHFNPRFWENTLVTNTFRNGSWDWSEQRDALPFKRGEDLDVIMAVTPEGYEIIGNGKMCCTFSHRVPLEEVSTIHIAGDLVLNTLGISEVDNITMKVMFLPLSEDADPRN